jgi:hypothetical protein
MSRPNSAGNVPLTVCALPTVNGFARYWACKDRVSYGG